jgi:integrase
MGHSRKEVADKMATLMRAHEEKRPIPSQREKVGPFLRRWLDEVAKPTLRASTYSSYDDILGGHLIPGLGQHRAREADAGCGPGVPAVPRARRRTAWMYWTRRGEIRWGMVGRNVAKLVDPPRVPKHEIRPLMPEQARQLIEAAREDRYRALYVTALGTGLRQGELLGLRWQDVDVDAGRLRVRHSLANVGGTLTLLEPKTERSRRHIVLPESVIAALRAHRTRQRMDRPVAGTRWVDSGHVFATTIGTPLHAATVTRAFRAALDRAGLPRSRFHDLRHATATFLLAQGMTLEDVKQLLGHSSITLTSNTYGHVLEQRQGQVAQAMDSVLGG